MDQLGAVDHLTVSLLFRDTENVPGVLRPIGIKLIAVEKFQRGGTAVDRSLGAPKKRYP